MYRYLKHISRSIAAVQAGLLLYPTKSNVCHNSELVSIPVVGGHAGVLSDGKTIFKPVLPGRRGRTEVEFYFHACPPEEKHRQKAVCRFAPQFFGVGLATRKQDGAVDNSITRTVSTLDGVDAASEAAHFVAMEDLTHGYRRPCIMDVKVGVQTWDEDAPPEKALREITKYPTQQVIGFRFTGMRVWNEKLSDYKEHGRTFGYQLDENTIIRAFYEYFHDGTRLRTELISPFLQKLRHIQAWFMEQDEYRFYGSSLLFLYDADPTNPVIDVRMIDFAHVWPIPLHERPGGRDEGYLLGLRTIIKMLEQLEARELVLTDGAASLSAKDSATKYVQAS